MKKVSVVVAAATIISGCAAGGGSFEWRESTWSGVGSLAQTSYGCRLNMAVINTTTSSRSYNFAATALDRDGNTVAAGSGATPDIDPGKRGTTWMTFSASCLRIERLRLTFR
ncbi:hypothetical protein [Reyranella sp.]|uniref:hypothetical protein n=1 Tax=Reyranella sp. TaxID=1929291 RepID=UPI003D0D76DF